MAMIGASAHIIARIFFAAAEVPYVFWIGGFASGLGPIVGPIVRSMTSKVVPANERGKVFALLSVCDNAVPFVSGVLYTQVHILVVVLMAYYASCGNISRLKFSVSLWFLGV